jgi:hypothetical protein
MSQHDWSPFSRSTVFRAHQIHEPFARNFVMSRISPMLFHSTAIIRSAQAVSLPHIAGSLCTRQLSQQTDLKILFRQVIELQRR